MTTLLSKEGVRGIGVTKCNVFKEFVMTSLLASTGVFHKKSKLFLIFVMFYVLFADVRYISDDCRAFLKGFLLKNK